MRGDPVGGEVCRRFLVSGRVQGVNFRASACAIARGLALDGWVRNLADGRVEVLARGAPAAMEDFERWLAHGPRHARVTAVVAEQGAETPGPGFAIC